MRPSREYAYRPHFDSKFYSHKNPQYRNETFHNNYNRNLNMDNYYGSTSKANSPEKRNVDADVNDKVNARKKIQLSNQSSLDSNNRITCYERSGNDVVKLSKEKTENKENETDDDSSLSTSRKDIDKESNYLKNMIGPQEEHLASSYFNMLMDQDPDAEI